MKAEKQGLGGSALLAAWGDFTIVFMVLSAAMPTSPWSAWCKLPLTPQLWSSPKSRPAQAEPWRYTSPTFSERSWLRRHFLFETIYPASVRKPQWEPPAAPGVNCCSVRCLLRWVRLSGAKSPCTELSGFWAPQLQITPGRLQPLWNHVTCKRICFSLTAHHYCFCVYLLVFFLLCWEWSSTTELHLQPKSLLLLKQEWEFTLKPMWEEKYSIISWTSFYFLINQILVKLPILRL